MKPANILVFSGRLGKDAEARVNPNGKELVTFSIAQDERRKNQQGEWETLFTSWVRVTVWDRDAQNLARQLTKGQLVTVTGKLQVRPWTTDDGQQRLSVDVVADRVDLAPNFAPQGQGQGGWQAQGHQQATNAWGSTPKAQPFPDEDQPPF